MTEVKKEKPVIFNLTRSVSISPVEFKEEKGYWEFTVNERNQGGKIHKVRFYSTNLMALQEKRDIEIYRYSIVNNKVNSDNISLDVKVKPSLFQILYTKYKERVKD
jgi:hypothetical protein